MIKKLMAVAGLATVLGAAAPAFADVVVRPAPVVVAPVPAPGYYHHRWHGRPYHHRHYYHHHHW